MFSASTPVTSVAFINREQELARLSDLLRHLEQGSPVWLAILGQRKIGKTSLLLELARRAPDPQVAIAILDVYEEIPVGDAFFRRYALRVLDAFFSRTLGLSLERLADDPETYRAELLGLPVLATLPVPLRRQVMELPTAALTPSFLRQCLELPEQLAQATGRTCLVAIDEFQELASLPPSRRGARASAGELLPLLRGIWQKHRRTAYIISGSAPSLLLELVSAEHSPFFQHFDVMELGPFSGQAARRLLQDASAAESPIPEALADQAVEAIGGHPFYLQLLGEALMRQPPPLDAQALKAALQELLFSPNGRLSLHFELEFNQLVGRSTFMAACLRALAEGPQRLTDLARTIASPSGATVRYLERLGDAVIREEHGRYQLRNPTFGLWLRWRKPGGSVVPMHILGDEAEKQVVESLARMGFELIYQSRASRGAFDLLATRGATQLGVQVKRGSLPQRFSKEAWWRMEEDARRFGWRWVIAVVTPEGRCLLLDPALARQGEEARIGEEAAIENLLQWLVKG